MNTITYTKEYFKGFSNVKFNRWIFKHRKELACGALFTYSTKGISPLIKKVTKKYAKSDFCPTHVGQICKVGEEIMVFNQTPPKGELSLLSDYIYNVDFDWQIVCILDDINTFKYSKDVLSFNGMKYGYFSAFHSAFACLKWIPSVFKFHCSEIEILVLQKQGYLKDIIADKIVPVEAYNLLVFGSKC